MSRAICVFCSSSNRVDPAYFAAARDLGAALARRGDTLVWGGGKVGLMGEVARACQAHGGGVIGVIPESMQDVEIAYHDADELIVTQTMRERKQIMDERADAFVVLPGGFGTLEELAEILVLKVLKYTDRPLVILNIDGFYDPLHELFEHFIEHRCAGPEYREMYSFVDSIDAVFEALDQAWPSVR